MSTDTIAVLDRALGVLRVLASRAEGYSLPEMCAELGLPKSTVRRFLQTMALQGFADYDEEKQRYTLGISILGLAAGHSQQNVLAVAVHPALEMLQRNTGETAALWVRVRLAALCLSSIESSHFVRTVSPIGRSIPLYASAHSKILLAGLSDGEVDDYLRAADIIPLTTSTIIDPAQLRREIEKAKANGVAVSRGEVEAEVVGIAAPVLDPGGRIIASLSVTAPAYRVTESRLEELTTAVREAAAVATQRVSGRMAPTVGRRETV